MRGRRCGKKKRACDRTDTPPIPPVNQPGASGFMHPRASGAESRRSGIGPMQRKIRHPHIPMDTNPRSRKVAVGGTHFHGALPLVTGQASAESRCSAPERHLNAPSLCVDPRTCATLWVSRHPPRLHTRVHGSSLRQRSTMM